MAKMLETVSQLRLLQFLGDAVYLSEPPYRGEELRFMLIHGPMPTMDDYGLTLEDAEMIVSLDEKGVPAAMETDLEASKLVGPQQKSYEKLTRDGLSMLQFFADLAYEPQAKPPLRGDALRDALAKDLETGMGDYGLNSNEIDLMQSGTPKDVIDAIRPGLPGSHWAKFTLMTPWPGVQICVHKVAQVPGSPTVIVKGLGFHRDPQRLVVEFQREGKKTVDGKVVGVHTTRHLDQKIIVEADDLKPGPYCVAVGDKYSEEWSSTIFLYEA